MNNLKVEFLEIIRPLESAELYVTESIEELKKEIYENMIPIGISENFVGAVEVNDILIFLERVKLNRKKQLLNSPIKVDLIYYVWYDSGAGQLRFNFINANHSKLPFGAKLNLDVSERQIVEAFIEDVWSMYNAKKKEEGDSEEPDETIDWEKLEQVEKERAANHTLSVYSEIIKLND